MSRRGSKGESITGSATGTNRLYNMHPYIHEAKRIGNRVEAILDNYSGQVSLFSMRARDPNAVSLRGMHLKQQYSSDSPNEFSIEE